MNPKVLHIRLTQVVCVGKCKFHYFCLLVEKGRQPRCPWLEMAFSEETQDNNQIMWWILSPDKQTSNSANTHRREADQTILPSLTEGFPDSSRSVVLQCTRDESDIVVRPITACLLPIQCKRGQRLFPPQQAGWGNSPKAGEMGW